ncbi:hypothetical protein HDA39_000791 [Kribbella italica]|uniref:Uncharacterized protein n=1 Tax=Kribbella italica TaxID=1540520 RepID=A0A7W9J2W6_9ACTN|nr:hypothetical protein [Kribbella italica]
MPTESWPASADRVQLRDAADLPQTSSSPPPSYRRRVAPSGPKGRTDDEQTNLSRTRPTPAGCQPAADDLEPARAVPLARQAGSRSPRAKANPAAYISSPGRPCGEQARLGLKHRVWSVQQAHRVWSVQQAHRVWSVQQAHRAELLHDLAGGAVFVAPNQTSTWHSENVAGELAARRGDCGVALGIDGDGQADRRAGQGGSWPVRAAGRAGVGWRYGQGRREQVGAWAGGFAD